MSSIRITTPARPASMQGPWPRSYCISSAARAISPVCAAVKARSPRTSAMEVDSAPGMVRAAMPVTSPRTSSRGRSAHTTWLRSRHRSSTRPVCPGPAPSRGRTRPQGAAAAGNGPFGQDGVEGRTWVNPRPTRPVTAEEVALGQEPWPHAPVPSLGGDVWHWQLEAMHVVSRVRADLRARIAHPSVCSTSTDDARDGLLLVFEELASNALRHGGGAVRALVVAGTDGWLLDLSDEARSEEHTSELQSRQYLVCRLL